jgi:hypothetical protein
MAEQNLLLISRDDILNTAAGKQAAPLYRTLARLTRGNYCLLATAPQPDRWTRSRGGPDEALLGADSISKRLSDAGGALDGIYYVPKSLLTRKRTREQALEDMLARYSVKPDRCNLYSSSRKFIDAANGMGILATRLGKECSLLPQLEALLEKTLKIKN